MKKKQVPPDSATVPPARTRAATSRAATSRAGGESKKASAVPPARQQRAAASAKPASKANATPPPAPDLYSSIHALLHTMRLIEQQEEPLCSMHDELKRTGKLSATHRRRLQQLVTELPAHVYQADLEAVQQALSA